MNLTDNEIIEALECCNIENKDCRKCSLQNKWDCHLILRDNVLGLINSQKAEIERLQDRYERTMDALKAVLEERADHTKAIKERF